MNLGKDTIFSETVVKNIRIGEDIVTCNSDCGTNEKFKERLFLGFM